MIGRSLTLWLILLGIAGAAGVATAQDPAASEATEGEPLDGDELETDRDSFTFATSTATPGKYILEASYSFIDNKIGPEAHSFPELLLRRGVTDLLELRLGWNYEAGGPGTVSGTEIGGEDLQVETEGRMLYGAKVQTSKPAGWVPESSLLIEGFTPTAGLSPATTMNLGEAWGWTFANGWTWNSAMRFATAYERGDYFNQWAPSTVVKVPVGERWVAHAEYFGIMTSAKERDFGVHFASFGAHVLVNPNLELGIRFGFGLNRESPGFFNNIGLGWRF